MQSRESGEALVVVGEVELMKKENVVSCWGSEWLRPSRARPPNGTHFLITYSL